MKLSHMLLPDKGTVESSATSRALVSILLIYSSSGLKAFASTQVGLKPELMAILWE